MPLPKRSRMVVGSTDLTMTLPSRAWIPEQESVGGCRVSAAGIPAAYNVRTDDRLHNTIRFYETEWPDVRDAVREMQEGESVTWYPDADEPGTSFEVYLDSPKMGESVRPTRGDFPRVMEITLVFRGVTVAPWLAYFDGF